MVILESRLAEGMMIILVSMLGGGLGILDFRLAEELADLLVFYPDA